MSDRRSPFVFLDEHPELENGEVVIVPTGGFPSESLMGKMQTVKTALEMDAVIAQHTQVRNWSGENNLSLSESEDGFVVKTVDPYDEHGYVYTHLIIEDQEPDNPLLLHTLPIAFSRQKVWLVSPRRIQFGELPPDKRLEIIRCASNQNILDGLSNNQILERIIDESDWEFHEAIADASWHWAQKCVDEIGDPDLARHLQHAKKLISKSQELAEGGDDLDHGLGNTYFYEHPKYGLIPNFADLVHGRKHIAEQLPLYGVIKERPNLRETPQFKSISPDIYTHSL